MQQKRRHIPTVFGFDLRNLKLVLEREGERDREGHVPSTLQTDAELLRVHKGRGAARHCDPLSNDVGWSYTQSLLLLPPPTFPCVCLSVSV